MKYKILDMLIESEKKRAIQDLDGKFLSTELNKLRAEVKNLHSSLNSYTNMNSKTLSRIDQRINKLEN